VIDEARGDLLRGSRRQTLVVHVRRGIAANEAGKALVRKLQGDHAQLRVDGIEPAGVGAGRDALAEQPRQPVIGELSGQRAEMRIDGVGQSRLPAKLVELRADIFDLRLGDA
jgi:hypothetical protein